MSGTVLYACTVIPTFRTLQLTTMRRLLVLGVLLLMGCAMLSVLFVALYRTEPGFRSVA